MNEEAGAVWPRRLLDIYPSAIWLNPEAKQYWPYRHSISIVRNLLGGRMLPLTLEGLERGIRTLSRRSGPA